MLRGKFNWLLLEQIFTAFSLFLYTGGLLRLVLSGGANQRDNAVFDSSLILLIFSVIYIITAFFLLLRWRKVLTLLSHDRWIVPLIVLTVASYFWSDFPAITLRRSVALLGTSLFGIYLSSRYTIRQQISLLGWAFGFSLIFSLIFVFAIPSYGVSSGMLEGAWRGIYAHKNGFGINMALAGIVFLILSSGNSRFKWPLFCLTVASVMTIIPARSTTALATFFFLLVSFYAYRVLRWKAALMVPAVLAVIFFTLIGWLFLSHNLDTILTTLGEDITLTGRTGFWPLVVEKILERPWLGYGYEAFWQGLRSESLDIYLAGSVVSHAHNGLLQLSLHLGLLGVVVFVLGYWNALLKAIRYISFTRTVEAFWPLLIITFIIPVNIAESSLMKYNDLEWVLYTSAVLSLQSLCKALPEMTRGTDPTDVGLEQGVAS